MNNLGDVVDYVSFILNKDQKGGRLNPSRIRTVIKAVNIEYLNDIRAQYENNSVISDDTRVVINTKGDAVIPTPLMTDVNGFVSLPDDYRHFSSLDYLKTVSGDCDNKPTRINVPVEMLTDSEFQTRMSSRLKGPSEKYPIGTIQNQRLHVLPAKKRRLALTYWKNPSTPYFDYIVSNGSIVYLPPGEAHDGTNPEAVSGTLSRSVEFDWVDLKRVADKMVRMMSVHKRAELPLQEGASETAKQANEWLRSR